jgi:hypothetical protein
MRRPLVSALALLILSLSLAFAVARGTAARDHVLRVAQAPCPESCSRCPVASSRGVVLHAGDRHGNPAWVPHAFVY